MYLIVLPEQLKIVARVSGVDQAVLISELDYPDTATEIFPAGEKKHFARYGRLDLMILLKNHNVQPAGIERFSEMLNQAAELGASIPLDQRSLFQLEQKAGPKPLPGDSRAIERKPFYQPLSEPCKDADMPAKPRAEKSASGPRAAPTKGATAKVWEFADALYGIWLVSPNNGNVKVLRASVVSACEEAGINPGTAATQFAKWKNSKGL